MAGLPGWEVEERFAYHLAYREAGRVLEFSAEMSSGPGVSIILYHDAPLTADQVHPDPRPGDRLGRPARDHADLGDDAARRGTNRLAGDLG